MRPLHHEYYDTPTPSSSAFISKEFCPTDVQFFFFHSYTISKLCTGLNSKQLRSNVVYDARLQNALYILGNSQWGKILLRVAPLYARLQFHKVQHSIVSMFSVLSV